MNRLPAISFASSAKAWRVRSNATIRAWLRRHILGEIVEFRDPVMGGAVPAIVTKAGIYLTFGR